MIDNTGAVLHSLSFQLHRKQLSGNSAIDSNCVLRTKIRNFFFFLLGSMRSFVCYFSFTFHKNASRRDFFGKHSLLVYDFLSTPGCFLHVVLVTSFLGLGLNMQSAILAREDRDAFFVLYYSSSCVNNFTLFPGLMTHFFPFI